MQLRGLEDWCALLDALKERGATHVKLTADGAPDGARLTGVEFASRPQASAPLAKARAAAAEYGDEIAPVKPRPAGLGY